MSYNEAESLYKDLEMFLADNYEDMELLVGDSKKKKAVMEDLKRLGSDTEFVDLYDHDEFSRNLKRSRKRRGDGRSKKRRIS